MSFGIKELALRVQDQDCGQSTDTTCGPNSSGGGPVEPEPPEPKTLLLQQLRQALQP